MPRTTAGFLMIRGLLGQPIKIGAFTSDDEKTPQGQTYEFDEHTFFDLRCAFQAKQQEQVEALWLTAKPRRAG